MNTIIIGSLKKLKSVPGNPIQYYLRIAEQEISLNNVLDDYICLNYTGNIYCIQCGRKTKKSFQQGFCFPCLQRLNECNLCVIHPERCQVEKGTCPHDDWAHVQCHQPHIVYLANSSGLKVGITRETQVPTRWIDQGAKQAIPIFKTSNRYQAGLVEVALKAFVSDRTNWREMLTREASDVDLLLARDELLLQAKDKLHEVIHQFPAGAIEPVSTTAVMELVYPVQHYLQKIQSLSFDQNSEVVGKLLGVKGQYLILEGGVINVRKFSGYEVRCQISSQ